MGGGSEEVARNRRGQDSRGWRRAKGRSASCLGTGGGVTPASARAPRETPGQPRAWIRRRSRRRGGASVRRRRAPGEGEGGVLARGGRASVRRPGRTVERACVGGADSAAAGTSSARAAVPSAWMCTKWSGGGAAAATASRDGAVNRGEGRAGTERRVGKGRSARVGERIGRAVSFSYGSGETEERRTHSAVADTHG